MRILILACLIACASKHADPLADFRATEHAVLQTFNDAFHRQKANQIDELAFAAAIERDVLPPWHALRTRMDAASIDDRELATTLHRYLEERETAWQAYIAALRAPSDAAAQPHLTTYHQGNADATRDARALADAFARR